MNWLVYALLSALFAGLVAIFGKVGMRDVDSTLATAARAIVMALALVALVLARPDATTRAQHISARAWSFLNPGPVSTMSRPFTRSGCRKRNASDM